MNLKNATILGVIVGLIFTRFLPDGNLLVSSGVVIFFAAAFRVLWILSNTIIRKSSDRPNRSQ